MAGMKRIKEDGAQHDNVFGRYHAFITRITGSESF